MATGDLIVFEESKALMLDGDWGSSDSIYCAILDNTTVPTAGFATPALGDFTQVGTAGSYATGGILLGVWATLVTETGGTVTFDSTTNPSWAKHASNDVDAYWGLVYVNNGALDAIAFVELGGPIDMSAGILTINWNALGVFRIV